MRGALRDVGARGRVNGQSAPRKAKQIAKALSPGVCDGQVGFIILDCRHYIIY